MNLTRLPLLIVLLVTLLPTASSAWDPLQAAGRAAARGQRAMAEGDTTEAIRNLMAAQALDPENERIRMGLGETLYRATDYTSARRQFESLALDPAGEWNQAALYNAGNAAFDAGDLQGALDLYTQALLRADGTAGPDLRHNLELTQRLLEEQEQEQSQEGEGEDQQDQQDQQDQEQQNQEQSDQQQEQQQQQQEEQESEGQPEEEEQAQQSPPEEQPEGEEGEQEEQPAQEQQMTAEEAMRLLQALDADEEELRKSIQRRLRGDDKATEHDW